MNGPIIANILLFYGILIIVNVPAPFLGLEFESGTKPRLWYQPPGFVIPIVWFVLFTMLGIAHHTLLQSHHKAVAWLLVALGILCATYAYYTLGLAKLTGISALWFGLWGNVAVILFALWVAFRVLPESKTAFYLVLPVAVWTTYATWIVLGEMKLEKMI